MAIYTAPVVFSYTDLTKVHVDVPLLSARGDVEGAQLYDSLAENLGVSPESFSIIESGRRLLRTDTIKLDDVLRFISNPDASGAALFKAVMKQRKEAAAAIDKRIEASTLMYAREEKRQRKTDFFVPFRVAFVNKVPYTMFPQESVAVQLPITGTALFDALQSKLNASDRSGLEIIYFEGLEADEKEVDRSYFTAPIVVVVTLREAVAGGAGAAGGRKRRGSNRSRRGKSKRRLGSQRGSSKKGKSKRRSRK